MLPEPLQTELKEKIASCEHPRELVIDVLTAIQEHHGHLSDEAVQDAAALFGLTPLEIDELATFYPFLYRQPVGRYVIHVCDSVICWMENGKGLIEHLQKRLGIAMGETTPDGLFTLLPVCCIGYCDRAPAILVNRKVHGPLNPALLDELIDRLQRQARDGEAAS
ncbi:NADH-quinone oxidoreductase subunit NuoE [Desulfatirhabdium butyrativorans]|uniref:NADH-quinone oxidoreductase subunit NuoE n=1 Tax=Desulfatirhabdium butyrativorans TaxID=340467 RepID=UPI00040C3693|nr:NADH-quinone oxidoreductase subunit NuoE [Desulfatirhabdium butyrativorans]